MKPYSAEISPSAGKKTTSSSSIENTPKIVFSISLALVLITLIPLYYYPLLSPSLLPWKTSSSPTPAPSQSSSPSSPSTTTQSSHGHTPLKDDQTLATVRTSRREEKCDMFRGEWVPNPKAPYYTNETCWAIHEHQNCMKFGRPDTEFMKWKWKPSGCELPVFNPAQFLELVRDKSLAFLGDSVGRNQMQSLMCLLSRVTYPVDASRTPDEKFMRWHYPVYNFTVANYWSPYLVRAEEADPNGPSLTGLFNLYLDEADGNWTSEIEAFDYVVVSAGHWFFRPAMFHENGTLIGCHYCMNNNITDLTVYYGFRRAFRTTFRTLNNLKNYKGMTFLRTFAPQHFENGEWNKGGDCVRKSPFRSNETRLEGLNLEMYMTQVEEFRVAEREGLERGLKFRLLDTTEAMLMRPDGHPGRYGRRNKASTEVMRNDCVHWCLPGPIDTWNDFLLQMLKMEGGRLSSRRAHVSERKMKIR